MGTAPYPPGSEHQSADLRPEWKNPACHPHPPLPFCPGLPQFSFCNGDRGCPASWAQVSGLSRASGGPALGGSVASECAVAGWWACLEVGASGGCQGWDAPGQLPPQPDSLSCLLLGECYELHVHCKTSFVGYFPAYSALGAAGPWRARLQKGWHFLHRPLLSRRGPQSLAAQLKPTTPFKADPGGSQPCGDQPDRGRRETRPVSPPSSPVQARGPSHITMWAPTMVSSCSSDLRDLF